MKTFMLVVVFLVVVDAASMTSDDDVPHSDASMIGSIFKLVKSGVFPMDGGRMEWEGGHVMPGVEDELKWGSPFEDPSVDGGYGWGGPRVYDECSDACMRTRFDCHSDCKKDYNMVFGSCHHACRDTENECLTACRETKDESFTGL